MSLQGKGVTAISNYLKNTLIPSVPSVRTANIYDNETSDLAGYPAVTITLDSQDSKVLDNARNQYIFKFTVRVFIDRNVQNFGVSQAETILRTMVGDVVSALGADYTLGGNCVYVQPFTSGFAYADRLNNNLRVMDISLQCIDVDTWR